MPVLIILMLLLLPDILKATSTSFNQHSVFNPNSSNFELNRGVTAPNYQNLLIGTTLGYFSKKLFQTGFFLPLGLVPNEIKNLSPLAYQNDDSELIFNEFENECFSKPFNTKKTLIYPTYSNEFSSSEYCLEKKEYYTHQKELSLVEKYY